MKVYSFECRAHPEAGGEGQLAGVVRFEVAFNGDSSQPKPVRCPLCGADCGVFGPWRGVEQDASAAEFQSKWMVALGVWEKVATEAGALRLKLSETATELLSTKAALEAKPVKGSEGLN